jgi:hypothetical protein
MTYYDDADYNNNIGYDDNDMSSMVSYNNKMSMHDDESVASNVKKRRKLIEEMKASDKDYVCIKRTIMVNDQKKTVKIEFYGTNSTCGYKIRDAITGAKSKYIVGSSDEYLFFKTALSTGTKGKEHVLLFYDTPEAYERNQHCTLSDDIKNGWRERYNNELLRRAYMADRGSVGKMVSIH